MTYGDILVTVLSETTGTPKRQFRPVLAAVRRHFPGRGRFDDELPDAEAKRILAELRTPQARQAVLAWLVRGSVEAHRMIAQAQREQGARWN